MVAMRRDSAPQVWLNDGTGMLVVGQQFDVHGADRVFLARAALNDAGQPDLYLANDADPDRVWFSNMKSDIRATPFVDKCLSAYVVMHLKRPQEPVMPNDTTRWTVSVSKETDIAVRSFLAQRGMKKGDLSKFIEDAVKWRVLEQTMAEARGKFPT
jgi:hypothetical protein